MLLLDDEERIDGRRSKGLPGPTPCLIFAFEGCQKKEKRGEMCAMDRYIENGKDNEGEVAK